ncbi:MAG: hypothetical protein ACYTE3_24780, partial [Planctomycetota bacterium]
MPARTVKLLVVLALMVLSLAIIGNSMTKPVGRDEHMYCTAAVLMAQGKMIYRDFSYAAQMPYHPLLCAMLFRLFGTTHYLLTVRLLSCVCDILVVLCIIGIYRHVFKPSSTAGTLLGLGAVVLYVFNPLVDYANGYAWNHDVVILCVVALDASNDSSGGVSVLRDTAKPARQVDKTKTCDRPALLGRGAAGVDLAVDGDSSSPPGILPQHRQDTDAVRPMAAR